MTHGFLDPSAFLELLMNKKQGIKVSDSRDPLEPCNAAAAPLSDVSRITVVVFVLASEGSIPEVAFLALSHNGGQIFSALVA